MASRAKSRTKIIHTTRLHHIHSKRNLPELYFKWIYTQKSLFNRTLSIELLKKKEKKNSFFTHVIYVPFSRVPRGVEAEQKRKKKKFFRSKDQTHRETVNERFTKSKMILCCVGEFFDFFQFFCVLLRTFLSFPPLPVDSEKKKHKIFARGSNFALEKCFFRATRLWLFPVFVVF